jgi:hypothetical protein
MTDGEALGDEIATLAGRINAANQRLLTCIRRFDEIEEWGRQGALSCAHWLTWRIGLDPATAREKVRVARALGVLPKIDLAFSQGRLSYAQVRAVTRIAKPESEEMILEVALFTTGAQLERICRGYRRASSMDKDAAADRRLRARPLGDGLVKVEVVLSADEAELFMKAIDRVRGQLMPLAEPASAAAQPPAARPGKVGDKESGAAAPRPTAADALVHLACSVLGSGLGEGGEGGEGGAGGSPDRGQVIIHVDRDLSAAGGQLRGSLEDGTHVSAETLRRVCCDGGLVAAALDEQGNVLDVGRRTRAIPTAIRRALAIRDRGCRFPGCASQRFLHGHHVEHWLHGGPTSLTNLILLCSFHHRQVHEGGFALRLTDDGNVEVRSPKGVTLPVRPTLAADPGSVDWWENWWGGSVSDRIDAWTATSSWDGEDPDYEQVLDAMLS